LTASPTPAGLESIVMSRELDRIRQALMRRIDEQDAGPLPSFPADSFFTFRYTRTEISAHGGGAHVKQQRAHFENGRMVTEEAEGTVDAAAFEQMAEHAQRHAADQMTQAMKLLLLPFSLWRRDRD
jgi:hypothetical protein